MKKVSITLLSIITLLFFISCGSKPAAEEQKSENRKKDNTNFLHIYLTFKVYYL